MVLKTNMKNNCDKIIDCDPPWKKVIFYLWHYHICVWKGYLILCRRILVNIFAFSFIQIEHWSTNMDYWTYFVVSDSNHSPPSDRHGKTLATKTVILDAVATMTQLMSVKLAAGYVLICLLILIVSSSIYILHLVPCIGLYCMHGWRCGFVLFF